MNAIAARLAAWAAALPPEARGAALLTLSTFCFASMDATAKGLMTRYEPMQVIWARYAVQALLVIAIVSPWLRSVARTRHLKLQVIRSGFLFGSTLCGFFAFSFMPLAEATAIFEVGPLAITALAALVLGEKVGVRRWTAVAVGFVGAMIVIRPGGAAFQPAALLPLAGAMSFAAYAIATRFLSDAESFWTTSLYSALLGAALASLSLPYVWRTPTAADAAVMLMMGAIGTAGQLLIIKAFNAAPASAIAPFTYAHLIWATFWGYVAFGDMPDLWTAVGAAVIVGSGVYVWRRERRLRGAS
jgi:drug/metabolite transporter (DMT)-like permease